MDAGIVLHMVGNVVIAMFVQLAIIVMVTAVVAVHLVNTCLIMDIPTVSLAQVERTVQAMDTRVVFRVVQDTIQREVLQVVVLVQLDIIQVQVLLVAPLVQPVNTIPTLDPRVVILVLLGVTPPQERAHAPAVLRVIFQLLGLLLAVLAQLDNMLLLVEVPAVLHVLPDITR
jgi:hypothetical protein